MKTKVQLVGVVILVALGFALWSGLPARVPKTDKHEYEEVRLSIVFKGDHDNHVVNSRYFANGQWTANRRLKRSPWNEKIRIIKGTKVILKANQDDPGSLTCFIQIIGSHGWNDTEWRDTPGGVQCQIH